MVKQGSVAPRERVNIVYKPATGNAREEKELPLKLVVMGISRSARMIAWWRTATPSAWTRIISTMF